MSISFVTSSAVTTDLFAEFRHKTEALYNPMLISMLRKGDIEITDIEKKYRTDEMILAYLEYNPNYISEIIEPTEDMCCTAINAGDALTIFKIPKRYHTEKVLMFAAIKNPYYIEDMPDQTEKICLCAVITNPKVIEFVNNKTEQICLAAVAKDPMTIRFVEDPSDNVINKAIQQDGCCIKYIHRDKWHYSMFIDCIKSDPFSIRYFYDHEECTNFLLRSAVYLNPMVINCHFLLKDDLPNDFYVNDLVKLAVALNYNVLGYIDQKLKTEEIERFACRCNAHAIQYVSHYTLPVITEAFNNDIDVPWKYPASKKYRLKFMAAYMHVKLKQIEDYMKYDLRFK